MILVVVRRPYVFFAREGIVAVVDRLVFVVVVRVVVVIGEVSRAAVDIRDRVVVGVLVGVLVAAYIVDSTSRDMEAASTRKYTSHCGGD